jgi:glycosyltransferase involved in cell wall biosynthesis
LDSIESQTDKPDQVIVVCSSSLREDIPEHYFRYSFPIDIVTREGRYNAAENRNEGIRRINTDIVSFFDADDVMHPQRIEIVRKYMCDVDILFHGYQTNSRDFVPINNPIVYKNQLIRGPTGCVVFDPLRKFEAYFKTPTQEPFDMSYTEWKKPLHHAQVSVRNHILDFIKFPENRELENRGGEDALFCGMIVSMGHIRNIFIENPLSYYRLRSD